MSPNIRLATIVQWIARSGALGVLVVAALFARPGLAATPVAKAPRVRVAKAPAWVEPLAVPTSRFAIDRAEGGDAWLLLDRQIRVRGASSTHYARVVHRVTSEAGVDAAGRITLDFAPDYESLVVHECAVRRGGELVWRVGEDDIRVLQRERSLEESVYDGRQTAMILLPDVRVGDEIEYAYSLDGANPVLGGRFAASGQLQLSSAVGVLRFAVQSDRGLDLRLHAGAPPPNDFGDRGDPRYVWELHDVAPYVDEADIPGDAFVPWVQVADSMSWADVAAWGRGLFALPQATPASLVEVADAIALQHESPHQRAVAALRLVQDEVRYFMLALGEGTHRPNPPELTLERRFGDCKDKTLLAVALLRELGIDAAPALVRTVAGNRLPEMLPGTDAFDHVIVAVDLEGRRYFVDPTHRLVRGTLEEMSPRGYDWALWLGAPPEGEADAVDLVEIPEAPQRVADIEAHQVYRFTDWAGPVELQVDVTFGDWLAVGVRNDWAASDREGFADRMLALVRETHPQAERVGDLAYEDHEDARGIEVRQAYRIPAAEALDDGTRTVSTFPLYARGLVPAFAGDRVEPLALVSPQRVVHDIEIHPPETIAVDEVTVSHDEGPVHFSFAVRRHGMQIHIQHAFEVVARRVEAVDLAALRAVLDRAEDNLAFDVWRNPDPPPVGSSFNWTIFMAGALWCVLLALGLAFVHVKQPWIRRREIEYDPSLKGFGGLLALLALRVSLAPLLVMRDTWSVLAAYSAESWSALTTPGGSAYDPSWAPLLLFELFANLTLVLGSIYLVYAFWAKRRSFTLLYVIVGLLGIVVPWVDDRLADWMFPGTDVAAESSFNPTFATMGALWIVYVLMSKRVRSTFLPAPFDEPGAP